MQWFYLDHMTMIQPYEAQDPRPQVVLYILNQLHKLQILNIIILTPFKRVKSKLKKPHTEKATF